MPGTETFVERYRRMSDAQLKEIAVAGGLEPEAAEALIAEMDRRGAGAAMVSAIQAGAELSRDPQSLSLLVDLFRKKPCPRCKRVAEPINAVLVSEVISALIITFRKQKLVLGCTPCLRNALRQGTILTAAVGWWGFPNGIIHSIIALNRNRKNRAALATGDPTPALLDFVATNTAPIIDEIRRNGKWQPPVSN